MGVRNDAVCRFLSDKERFADFFNGTIFKGEQRLEPGGLELCSGVYYPEPVKGRKHKQGIRTQRQRDVLMRDKKGMSYAMLGIEAQDEVHYAMPVRCMEYDVCEYKKQLGELKKAFERKAEEERITETPKCRYTAAERLSKMRCTDRLNPVMTVVFYHGMQPYDGCKDLHGMIHWNQENRKYQPFVENYRMNLLTLKDIREENFHTGLRELIGTMKCSGDKKALLDYCIENEERLKDLDEETYDTICVMIGRKELLSRKRDVENSKGGFNMCKAIEDIKKEELQKGRREGLKKGENRVNQLNRKLVELNRMSDLVRAAGDRSFQKQLFQEFNL